MAKQTDIEKALAKKKEDEKLAQEKVNTTDVHKNRGTGTGKPDGDVPADTVNTPRDEDGDEIPGAAADNPSGNYTGNVKGNEGLTPGSRE